MSSAKTSSVERSERLDLLVVVLVVTVGESGFKVEAIALWSMHNLLRGFASLRVLQGVESLQALRSTCAP